MEFCQTDLFLHSPAAQQLSEFIRKRHEKWVTQTDLCGVVNLDLLAPRQIRHHLPYVVLVGCAPASALP
jgi:hypothetical protein